MFFVTAFLLGVGILFLVKGIKGSDTPTIGLGASFLIAAVATGFITWLAMSALSV